MSLTKLGSGVVMLGYYMYHGGTNPKGKFSTLEESKATGYPNNVSVLSYDFRAPIRQFGQVSDTYKEIKLLALFAKDFGQDLVTLPAEIDLVGVDRKICTRCVCLGGMMTIMGMCSLITIRENAGWMRITV